MYRASQQRRGTRAEKHQREDGATANQFFVTAGVFARDWLRVPCHQ